MRRGSPLWCADLALLVILPFSSAVVAGEPPFDGAAAVWHMADLRSSAGRNTGLTAQGEARVGVELQGPEREASLNRGGDGRVAQIRGGYLRAGLAARDSLTLSGGEMTLCARLRDTAGRWNSPLFGKDDPGDRYGKILYGRDGRLHYVWRTEPAERRIVGMSGGSGRRSRDFMDGVLRLGVPVKMIGAAQWHDIVVRFRGPNLELFVDGVLVDEEWPHGTLYQFCSPFLIGASYEDRRITSGFQGLIDHVALWDRALTDEEIISLSGDKEEVARRDIEILGRPGSSMQYWKPRGQAYAGDCIPFFHDGTFHLFYLFDRRHHGSKWGLGAHQHAHASTRDLTRWEHHPLAVPILEQWECSMGTCDAIYNPKDGKTYVFYTDCGSRAEFKDRPQRGSWIFAATSTDGVHFTKSLKALVPGHDCEVFQDRSTGLFHLIRGGGNRLVSRDLLDWEETPGDFAPRRPGTSAECPNHFEWNGWYYFILGRNALWKSRGPLGPWTEIDPNVYDGLMVPNGAESGGIHRQPADTGRLPGVSRLGRQRRAPGTDPEGRWFVGHAISGRSGSEKWRAAPVGVRGRNERCLRRLRNG